jgi:hypothetical protein
MLGGYITESKQKNKAGVPVLKDIPVLGALFRSKSIDNSRSEVIILMHVTVLKSPVDAAAQAEAAKSVSIKALEKEFKDDEIKRRHQLEWESGRDEHRDLRQEVTSQTQTYGCDSRMRSAVSMCFMSSEMELCPEVGPGKEGALPAVRMELTSMNGFSRPGGDFCNLLLTPAVLPETPLLRAGRQNVKNQTFGNTPLVVWGLTAEGSAVGRPGGGIGIPLCAAFHSEPPS